MKHRLAKWGLVALLLLHGAIQVVAGISQLGIIASEFTASAQNDFQAYLWLVAGVFALAAAIMCAFGRTGWRTLCLVAAASSQVMCVLQWSTAAPGTLVNVVVCLLVVASSWPAATRVLSTSPTTQLSRPK